MWTHVLYKKIKYICTRVCNQSNLDKSVEAIWGGDIQ